MANWNFVDFGNSYLGIDWIVHNVEPPFTNCTYVNLIVSCQAVLFYSCQVWCLWCPTIPSPSKQCQCKSLPIEKHLNGLTFTFMLHHACGKMGNIATTTKKIEKVGKWWNFLIRVEWGWIGLNPTPRVKKQVESGWILRVANRGVSGWPPGSEGWVRGGLSWSGSLGSYLHT